MPTGTVPVLARECISSWTDSKPPQARPNPFKVTEYMDETSTHRGAFLKVVIWLLLANFCTFEVLNFWNTRRP